MSSSAAPQTKKKKAKTKGPVPAHQNATAWRHNPKSKKTAKILAAPISGVCRRCRQKLEWRKKYRKYKPRTVAGSCNLCQKRNVHAAYHTICASCSTSNETVVNRLRQLEAGEVGEEGGEREHTTETEAYRQICCICVKEPALGGDGGRYMNRDDENDGAASASTNRPLRLRQLKTLERQQMGKVRRTREDRPRSRSGSESEDSGSESDAGTSDEDEHGPGDDDASDADADGDDFEDNDEDEEEEKDPFLRAVGGKHNLLVGEAYQQRLLKLQLQDPSGELKAKPPT